jgi:D-gamma-glutamyl-meso-diaminopimelic acid endopeptidase CwlS
MQKIKLCITILLVIALLVSGGVPALGETPAQIEVMVDNRHITGQAPAAYHDGVIMAPAAEFAESLGGSFKYDSTSMTGILKQGENEFVFHLDDNVVQFNGKYVKAPAPMKIIGYRFMIPAEFTAGKLGAQLYRNSSRNQLMIFTPQKGNLVYRVMWGDTLWIISQLFGTTVKSIKELNGLTSDMIYGGQDLVVKRFTSSVTAIPAYTTNGATIFSGKWFDSRVVNYLKAWTNISVVGKNGGWYKVKTPKGDGYIYHTVLGIKQDMGFGSKSTFFNREIPVDTSGNTIKYVWYTVQKGDYIWAVSEKYGIPDYELAAANKLSSTSTLYVGQVLKIPVHHIAKKKKTGSIYGEILDWYKEGQYVFPLGKTGKLTDLQTGKSFMVKRTIGASHSDTETLTKNDTSTMKEIFGGYWNWNRRPFILEVDGRRFAVSVSGMPHGGVDGVPFLQNTAGRSDNWGYGPNYDAISGNGMNGHFDLYFLNGYRHSDGEIDSMHQYNAMLAGGLR